jgi:hypothetical protein
MRTIRPSLASALLAGVASWPLVARGAPPPSPAHTLEQVLRQTAAVVEGHVEDVSYRYDEVEGPRTVATLSRLVVHLGSLGPALPPAVEIRSFGGRLPDGREVLATHVPALLPGKRYLVFLRNTEWTLSPIAFDQAYRIETVASVPVLVDPHGRLVMGMGARGPVPGPSFFMEPERGGLDPASAERVATWITPDVARGAMDTLEMVAGLRAFAAARDAWPSGEFSPFPVIHAPSWSRIFVAPAPPEETSDDGDALACLDEPGGDADVQADEMLVCMDGGGS